MQSNDENDNSVLNQLIELIETERELYAEKEPNVEK